MLAGNIYCLACHIDLLPDPAGVTNMVDASAKLLLIAELVALEDRLDVNVEKAPKYYARHKTWDPPPPPLSKTLKYRTVSVKR